MGRPNYTKWTRADELKLAKVYRAKGIRAALQVFPGLSDTAIRAKVKRLNVQRGGQKAKSLDRYGSLAPLAPEDEQESAWDKPRQVRKATGQWKADIPKVRWVFDLGLI